MSKLKKLPDGCTFPQMALVIDAARFQAHLQAHLSGEFADGSIEIQDLKMKKVYYKPGRSCRILFDAELRGSDGVTCKQNYYAKIFAEDKAAKIYARALQGNASATNALEMGPRAVAFAKLAWRRAQGAGG